MTGVQTCALPIYNVVYKAIVDSEVVSEVIRKVEVVDSKDPVITTTFFESDSTIKLVASDAYYFDNFGSSVDKYGNYVVVGANSDDDNGGYSGSAYLYKLNDKTFEIKITPTDGKEVGLFGNSVSIDGDYIIVGAPGRSEERRVGKECRSRWVRNEAQKKESVDSDDNNSTHRMVRA